MPRDTDIGIMLLSCSISTGPAYLQDILCTLAENNGGVCWVPLTRYGSLSQRQPGLHFVTI